MSRVYGLRCAALILVNVRHEPQCGDKSVGDDLRLDFGGALENVEDAGVAENPRHRKFERKAVAAVHLHRVVGGGLGDARRQELRHAGLEIAAASGIILPRRIIGELARDHDLDRHHGDLVGDAREIGDRLAELHARAHSRGRLRAPSMRTVKDRQ
jgi:hypothetical protein